MGLFSNFLYTFTINQVTTEARKMHIEYMFCFICSEQCIQNISSHKRCSFFSSAFKKFILNNISPSLQEVGGVTQPLILCC